MNESSKLRERLLVWWRVSPAGRTMGAIGSLFGLVGIWIGMRSLGLAGWTLSLIVGLMALSLLLPLSALLSWRFQRGGERVSPGGQEGGQAP